MKSLDELPTLGELKDIDSLNEALELDEPLVAPEEVKEEQDEEHGSAVPGDSEISESSELNDSQSDTEETASENTLDSEGAEALLPENENESDSTTNDVLSDDADVDGEEDSVVRELNETDQLGEEVAEHDFSEVQGNSLFDEETSLTQGDDTEETHSEVEKFNE
jgi:segregation and condensation protein B